MRVHDRGYRFSIFSLMDSHKCKHGATYNRCVLCTKPTNASNATSPREKSPPVYQAFKDKKVYETLYRTVDNIMDVMLQQAETQLEVSKC